MSWFNSKKQIPEITTEDLKEVEIINKLTLYMKDGTIFTSWFHDWEKIKDQFEENVDGPWQSFLDWWTKKKTKSYLMKSNHNGKVHSVYCILRSEIKSFTIELEKKK